MIYYTSEYTDDAGRRLYVINGDTSYCLDSGWTKESAEKDYCSEEGKLQRQIDFMQANGFYD